MFYLVAFLKTVTGETASQIALRNCSKEVREELGYRGVFAKLKDFPGGSDGKESVCHAGDPGLIPGSGRSLTLPGEFHGQRSPVGYSPWGCRELDMTKQLTHTHICNCRFGNHKSVFYVYESSLVSQRFIYIIFSIPHISDIK